MDLVAESALYQDQQVYRRHRDEKFTVPAGASRGWSYKGGWFHDLASAKNYIQMSRDEEGNHFGWPQTIPVYWKKGDLTFDDVVSFPGWEEVAEI